jgi:hypothetical protein
MPGILAFQAGTTRPSRSRQPAGDFHRAVVDSQNFFGPFCSGERGYSGVALANSVPDLAPACQRRPGLLLLQSTLCALAVPNPPPDAYSIEPPILVSLKLRGQGILEMMHLHRLGSIRK